MYYFFMQYVLMLVEITDFDADGPLQGLSHANGVLQVLQSGTYYIYAQAFFEAYPGGYRLALVVNGETVSLLQNPPGQGSQYGSRFTGVIKKLTEGDYICLRAVSPSKLWMEKAHTFFGAMSISI